MGLIPLGVYLHSNKILLECHKCLVNSVLRNIGHCVKYIGVLSVNYLPPFPDFLHREYFAQIALINNICWSAFSVNRVKMLIINIKSEEVLKKHQRLSSWSRLIQTGQNRT
jgi:hypothetical protein